MVIAVNNSKRLTGGSTKGPSKAELVFVFLVTLFIPNSAYIVFNMPQLFEDVMIHKFQIKPVEFEAIYSVYSMPNFIAVPLGSQALSYTGLGFGSVIFGGIVYFGLVIMHAGFYIENYLIVFIGRAIFGMGAETLMCTAPAIFGKWFMGKALSISQAMNRAVINAGISLSIIYAPGLFVETRSMGTVFLFYGLATFLSFIAATMYTIFEYYYEKKANIDMSKQGSVVELQMKQEAGENIISVCKEEDMLDEKDKIFTFADFGCYPPTFWLLTAIFALGTNIYLSFNTFATDFFMNRFGYQYTEATRMFAIYQVSCIFIIPILSFLTTPFGRKGFLLILAFVICGVNMTIMSLLPPEPNKPLHSALMFSYAVFGSLLLALIWPCMTLCVPSRGAALAFGMATSVQNVLIATLPLYFGAINKDRSVRSYNLSLYSLIVMCIISGVLSLWVTIYDLKRGSGLINLPENSKKVEVLRNKIEADYYKYKLEKRDQRMGSEDYKTMVEAATTHGANTEVRKETQWSDHIPSRRETEG